MISRRQLRVKTMQALYAYSHSIDKDLNLSEKALFTGIEKLYDSYLSLLALLVQVEDAARNRVLESANKLISENMTFDANPRLMDNAILNQLSGSPELASCCKRRSISWQKKNDLVKKLFAELRKTEEYITYINSEDMSYAADLQFVLWMVKKFFNQQEEYIEYMEYQNLFWADDADFVHTMVVRTIKSLGEEQNEIELFGLYKDEEDDINFVKQLFRKSVIHGAEFEQLISDKVENWDIERIAATDVIIMKMTLAEIITFSNIPVKVSINEYIDISKQYSTVKSGLFINGIIDKIVADFRKENKIQKMGRGLLE